MSLLNVASLVLTPNAVKDGKIYSIIPSNGNGDMTVVRATTATRVNSLGNIENVGLNVARLNYEMAGGCPSILLEPQRTNRLLNSSVVVTQTIATSGLIMTVSFYGTGTIVFSGTYVGTLVGTGTNNRVSLTFTPTTGNLVLTVTGSCTNGQVETGGYATSYIPTVATTITRNADIISRSNIFTNGLITSAGGTWFVELNNNISLVRDNFSYGFYINTLVNGDGDGLGVRSPASGRYTIGKVSAGIDGIMYTTLTDTVKIAIKWNGVTADVFVNGVKVVVATAFTTTNMEFLRGNVADTPRYIKSTMLFPTPLTDAELISLTTL